MNYFVLALCLAGFSTAHADNFIGNRHGVEIQVGANSDQLPEAKVRLSEGLTNIFGFNGYTDVEAGFSSIDYLKLNIRLVLAEGGYSDEHPSNRYRVFLVMPFLGDIRMRAGRNDPRADSWDSNLSMDASYGGLGVELVREITPSVRIAVRGAVAHRGTGEMLPGGYYTTEGALIMNRRDEDGSLVTNVIDASGTQFSLKVQAEVLKKLLLSFTGAASRISQNGIPYRDQDGELRAQYEFGRRGKAKMNLYADYYWRVTDLTDLGTEHRFRLFTGGLDVRW